MSRVRDCSEREVYRFKTHVAFYSFSEKTQLRFSLVLGKDYSPPYIKAKTQRELKTFAGSIGKVKMEQVFYVQQSNRFYEH